MLNSKPWSLMPKFVIILCVCALGVLDINSGWTPVLRCLADSTSVPWRRSMERTATTTSLRLVWVPIRYRMVVWTCQRLLMKGKVMTNRHNPYPYWNTVPVALVPFPLQVFLFFLFFNFSISQQGRGVSKACIRRPNTGGIMEQHLAAAFDSLLEPTQPVYFWPAGEVCHLPLATSQFVHRWTTTSPCTFYLQNNVLLILEEVCWGGCRTSFRWSGMIWYIRWNA